MQPSRFLRVSIQVCGLSRCNTGFFYYLDFSRLPGHLLLCFVDLLRLALVSIEDLTESHMHFIANQVYYMAASPSMLKKRLQESESQSVSLSLFLSRSRSVSISRFVLAFVFFLFLSLSLFLDLWLSLLFILLSLRTPSSKAQVMKFQDLSNNFFLCAVLIAIVVATSIIAIMVA